VTFCLGIKVKEGLVGIADTRITSGSEHTTSRKLSVFENGHRSMFLMTSGLRSVRDKALTYFEEMMAERDEAFDKVYKAVNAFAEQIRRVSKEDRQSLEENGLKFNISCLVGGQLSADKEHKLYLLYPEGNWIEVTPGTPYLIIGESGFGKPILVRSLKHEDSMKYALKVGCLAFDSTRISASDVDYPIDVVLYEKDSYRMIEHRFNKDDLSTLTNWWQERLRQSVDDLPSECVEALFQKLAPALDGNPIT
jgi:putative proteasome-type protease